MTTTAVHPQDLELELDLLAETARQLTAQLTEARIQLAGTRIQLAQFRDAFAFLAQAAVGGLVQIRRPGAATLLTTRVDAAAADVLVAAPTLLECVQRTQDICAMDSGMEAGR